MVTPFQADRSRAADQFSPVLSINRSLNERSASRSAVNPEAGSSAVTRFAFACAAGRAPDGCGRGVSGGQPNSAGQWSENHCSTRL